MSTTTTNYALVKPALTDSPPDITVLNQNFDKIDTELKARADALATHEADITAHAELAIRDIYVSTTGNDITGDGSSGKPYKTIEKALSAIKKIIFNPVTIILADGTYTETITIRGFMGGIHSYLPKFIIKSLSGNPDNCMIDGGILVRQNSLPIQISSIQGINISVGFGLDQNCAPIWISNCKHVVNANTISGVSVNACPAVRISNCVVSNKGKAIEANNNSNIFSEINSGSGNVVGLSSWNNATIGKYSTQPSGTTAESSGQGGVIR
jgi:hypothetical protein